ncbi:MAG TPA: AI-2E family transporter, partial [Ktedonobacterales bacterium]|nr:AI-2E family transporter [Ktedonobacterales bacterium]
MASETVPPETTPAAAGNWFRLQWLVPLAITLVLIYAARTIITPFVLAIVLAYLLDPFVASVHRYTRAPRGLVVVVMALLALSILGGVIALLVDVASKDGQTLLHHFPDYLSNAVDNVNTLLLPTTIQIPKSALPGVEGNPLPNFSIGEVLSFAVSFARSTGQGLLDFLLTFISTIYLLIEGHHIANGIQRFFPLEHRPRLGRVMNSIRHTWSSYIRVQLMLAALMAVVSWVVLDGVFRVLGHFLPAIFGGALPFALPIAITIGLMETIPIVGPLVAIGLATIVALATLGIVPAVMVAAALYVLRLVEDNVVIPNVLGRAIHLPAIVTLFAVTVGGLIAGLVGLLLAVPIAAALKVVIDEYYPHPPDVPVDTAPAANHAGDAQPAPAGGFALATEGAGAATLAESAAAPADQRASVSAAPAARRG